MVRSGASLSGRPQQAIGAAGGSAHQGRLAVSGSSDITLSTTPGTAPLPGSHRGFTRELLESCPSLGSFDGLSVFGAFFVEWRFRRRRPRFAATPVTGIVSRSQ
jgi:hypothetical protein